MSKGNTVRRIDRSKEHNTAFIKNKKRILATQDYCYICGKLVDKSLPVGSDMSPEIDHIISIKAGGHPSDINNLALTHRICNRKKGDRTLNEGKPADKSVDALAWTVDWSSFGK